MKLLQLSILLSCFLFFPACNPQPDNEQSLDVNASYIQGSMENESIVIYNDLISYYITDECYLSGWFVTPSDGRIWDILHQSYIDAVFHPNNFDDTFCFSKTTSGQIGINNIEDAYVAQSNGNTVICDCKGSKFFFQFFRDMSEKDFRSYLERHNAAGS